jgi:hypothetical protein
MTKRKRVIVRPVPERQTTAAPVPDFLKMLKEIYGTDSQRSQVRN